MNYTIITSMRTTQEMQSNCNPKYI